MFFLFSIIYCIISAGGFLVPLWYIYRPRMKKLDLGKLWLEVILIYSGFSFIIVPIFLTDDVTILLSVEMISVLTIAAVYIWYAFQSVEMENFLNINLILHIESMVMIYILEQINENVLKINFLCVQYVVILLVMGIQILLMKFNRKVAVCFKKKGRKRVLFIILVIVLLGIYMYQLVLQAFFVENSVQFEYENIKEIQQNDLVSYLRIFLLFVVIFNVGAVFITRNHLLKTRLKEREVRQQELEDYIKTMELLQKDIRKMHHDYKNLIVALGGYLYEEDGQVDIEGLREYYKENLLLQKNTELKVINLAKLQNMQILEIKGLLAAKVIQGCQQSIVISIEIYDVIVHISMDIVDIIRVIGNLLDNAIEAARESESPEMHIAFIQGENSIIFVVENTVSKTQMTALPQMGKSSKGRGRGLGLENVMDIIDSYPNVFQESQMLEGWFQKKIVICNE